MIATAEGHLDRIRQRLDSTSQDILPSNDSIPTSFPKRHTVYVKTVPISDTAHSDLTGRFPVPSITGNQYLLISTMDGYILAKPLSTHHHSEYVKSYQRTLIFFRAPGYPIIILRLDNETSSKLEQLARKICITIQYHPPSNHRVLITERSIRV